MRVSAVGIMMGLLRADAGMQAAVGDRVFAEIAPQDATGTAAATLPHAVVRLAGGHRDLSLAGDTFVRKYRVVVIGFATTFAAAETIAHAVEGSCDANRSVTVDGKAVRVHDHLIDVSDFVADRQLFRRAKEIELIVFP